MSSSEDEKLYLEKITKRLKQEADELKWEDEQNLKEKKALSEEKAKPKIVHSQTN